MRRATCLPQQPLGKKHNNQLAILRPFWDTSVYPGCNVLYLDNLIPYARNRVFFKNKYVMNSGPRLKESVKWAVSLTEKYL